MRTRAKITSILLSSVLVLSVTGCSGTLTGSLEADAGLKAFNEIANAYPENIRFHNGLQHWVFKISTGERFEWTSDMSASKGDYAMVLLADPLIKAGLDVSKLDENEWLFETAGRSEGEQLPNRLIKQYNISDRRKDTDGSEDSMRWLFKTNSKIIKHRKDFQYYSLILGEGNEVQWTEKLGLSDADMIFVLKAEPLEKAGLDVNKLEGSGWVFKEASKDDMGMGENPDQIVQLHKIKK